MGYLLNRGSDMLEISKRSRIYVDKSGLIARLNEVIDTEDRFICMSRPRRFGKTMAANMVSTFYDHTVDGKKLFEGMEIAKDPSFAERANKYNVIFINMIDYLEGDSLDAMLNHLKQMIILDLLKAYPDFQYTDNTDLSRVMYDIYANTHRSFIVIIDEWDCVMRLYQGNDLMQKEYLNFLRRWLKDKSYIALAYMTGILPVKKYGQHSALNMFTEVSMTNPGIYAPYMAFTESEVKQLCEEKQANFDEIKSWYDGYRLEDCEPLYNPRSVVTSIVNKKCGSYWVQTETFEALKKYIIMNYDGLKDCILQLMANETVQIETRHFANDMETFESKDDILTLLVHLGYLGYDAQHQCVFIPNREIYEEFVVATSSAQWDEIIHSVKRSQELLDMIWQKNEKAVALGIQSAHLETSHIQYNDENALAYTLSLALYAARQYYTVIRELPAGNGFADLTLIPKQKYQDKPAIVIELKWNKSANTAIQQIINQQYTNALANYQGTILLAGVNYSKKTRKHQCKIVEITK